MNKRQAKKRFKKKYGRNPPKGYTPAEAEKTIKCMEAYGVRWEEMKETIQRMGNAVADVVKRVGEAMRIVCNNIEEGFRRAADSITVKQLPVETFKEIAMDGFQMPIIAVYEHPDDYPEKYVARIFDCQHATEDFIVKDSLEEIRADIAENTKLTPVPRGAEDVLSLVEVWM